MPTDATGTPTSLGIPTFNVDVDEPSGLGFNEAMAIIDSLLVARSGVSSFIGRTGNVTANTGDYTAAKVTNAADLSSGSAQVFNGPINVNNTSGISIFNGAGFSLRTWLVNTDANPAWSVFKDGTQAWGPGGATATDTNLYRGNVGQLKTDSLFYAVNGFIGQTPSGNNTLRNFLLGTDANPAFAILGNGTLEWGPGGGSAIDVTLARTAAGVLLSNGALLSSSPTKGVGYATGAGGTAAESGGAVTINKVTGQISMSSHGIAAGGSLTVTVTDSAVAASDLVVVNPSLGSPLVIQNIVAAAGSWSFVIVNFGATTINTLGSTVNFAVIKGVFA